MNRISLFTGLFFLLLQTNAFAQKEKSPYDCNLLLRVQDGNNNDRLEGAIIKIESNPGFFITDSAGNANIPSVCGQNSILIQMFGYRNYVSKIEISRATRVTIKLESTISQLEEVVISSQSERRNLESPSLGVSMLNVKAVQKLPPAGGEVDVIRSLQTLPGISTVGEGANGYNVRGGSVDQNLILIDNMPVFNPTHMLGLFSLFPADGIRELQIYKGSIPAKYGGRTASVLDVKLAEPDMNKFSIKGGVGMISNRLSADLPIVKNKLGWITSNRISFNGYLIDLYNSDFFNNFRKRKLPDADPRFYDLTNKITWRPTSKDNISISSYIGYDSYKIDSIFGIAGIVPKQSTMQYGHVNGAIKWNHYFSKKFNNNLLVVQSRYNTNTLADENKTGFEFKTNVKYTSIKDEIAFSPNANQRIIAGVTVSQYNLKPGNLEPTIGSSVSTVNLNSEKGIESALFISDEYEVNKNLLIDIGVRLVNYLNLGPSTLARYEPNTPREINTVIDSLTIKSGGVESSFSNVEPRLGLRYKLNDLTSVKFGYNRMNQYLQMLTNLTTPLPTVRWKSSNRYLQPIHSNLLSLGVFKNAKNGRWEWSLEGYYRNQKNIVDFVNGAELTVSQNIETQFINGKAKSYGLELMLNKKKGVVTGWASYTYSRSLQQIKGDYPEFQQLNSGKWFPANIDKPHNLNMILSLQAEKHNVVSFTFAYASGRPYTAPVSFYRNGFRYIPIFTERNNGRISPYHRLDFSWTIINPSTQNKRWEGSWVITIYNLYGRKNAFSYYFDPKQPVFKPFKVSVFSFPITSLTYNFTFN